MDETVLCATKKAFTQCAIKGTNYFDSSTKIVINKLPATLIAGG